MSKPDSIAACDGSVEAWRIVRADIDHDPLCMMASCTGG